VYFLNPLKILLFGSGERAVHCVDALLQEPLFHVVGIVLEPGMENDVFAKHVAHTAVQSLKTFYPASFKPGSDGMMSDGMQMLEQLNPDLAVLCVYEKIVSSSFLNFFRQRKGCINLHGGKVPEYRGSSVLRWQIIDGAKTGAFTILEVDEQMDTSFILGEYQYPITETTTIQELIALEHTVFPKLLVETIKSIHNGTVQKRPQQGTACYWHKRKEEDRHIVWEMMHADAVLRLIRAEGHPYPGAFCFVDVANGKNAKKLRVGEASHTTDQLYKGTPGRVARSFKDGSVVVIAKDKGILIKKAGFDGEPSVSAGDILNFRMQLC